MYERLIGTEIAGVGVAPAFQEVLANGYSGRGHLTHTGCMMPVPSIVELLFIRDS